MFLYVFVKFTIMITTVVIIDPIIIGILNNNCNPIPAPKISAIAVAILAKIAVDKIGNAYFLGIFSVVDSAIHLPVTIPKCAALCCNTINIIVDNVTVHKSLYPYSDPAAIFEAQFPGSINPIVTKIPGPIYLNVSITSLNFFFILHLAFNFFCLVIIAYFSIFINCFSKIKSPTD